MSKAISTVVSIGGMFKGGFFTGAFSWAALGLWAAQRFLTPRQVYEGPRLTDLTVQAAEYGYDVPKIFGTLRTTGAIVWSDGLTEHVQESDAGGGGSGPPEPTVREYHYTWNGAILWGQGEIERIEEIRYNDQVIYYNDGSGLASILGYEMEEDPITGTLSGSRVSSVDMNWGLEPSESAAITDGSALTITRGNALQLPHATLEAVFGVGKTPAYRGDVITYFDNFDCGTNGLGTFSARIRGSDGSLSEVVAWLWEQVGVSANEIDTSELDELTVDGLIIQRSQAASYLRLLENHYFFDIAHEDGKEKCKLRGRDTVLHIPDSDLRAFSLDSGGMGGNAAGGASGGSGNRVDTLRRRGDLIAIPATEELQFLSRKRDFHPDVVGSDWESEPQSNYNSVAGESVPLVITKEEAQRIIDIKHHLKHIEHRQIAFATGSEYRYLGMADPITINVRGVPTRYRLTDVQRSDYGVLSFRGVRDIKELYDAPLGEEGEEVAEPQLTSNGSIYFGVLDTPIVRDIDAERPGVYIYAATPYDERVRRHYFELRNTDNRTLATGDWQPALATLGLAVNALGDWNGGVDSHDTFAEGSETFDTTNTLTVDLVSGTLESATESAVLTGANAALLGNDTDGWEIVQWQSATYDAGGSPAGKRRYLLEGLLRGRRGTENAIGSHHVGDLFLLLNSSVRRVSFDAVLLNRQLLGVFTQGPPHMGVVANKTVQFSGVGIKPLAPIDLEELSYRESDGALNVRGQLRSRLLDTWFAAGSGLQLAPYDTLTVQVEIVSSGRLLTGTADETGEFSIEYSAAMQTADSLTPGDPVTVRASQKSSLVGFGFECEVVL